ncbi:MAG TPA: glycosyltransferase family 4 protein [Vicinamibacterales bacterium]|nr:glycosyltransferase family 4 protein [Vicinamibacterales bacterium]
MIRRIILVTPAFAGRDGISAVARQLASALPPLGTERSLEVWALADSERPAGLDKNIVFRCASGRRIGFASLTLRSAASLHATLVLVTHVHLLPVVLPLQWRGARVAPILMGIEAWKPLRPLEARALRHAWRVLAISRHTIERFKAANPSLADLAIAVCHPAVPTRTPERQDRIGGRYALIVGRMSREERYKGHDLLIDVWPLVQERVPDATLVIVGGGDDRERLQQRVADAGLDCAIRFTGAIDDATLAAHYRDAVLFVMPSRDEGFGLVFLEAMRAGTPCIAATGAAEEIVRDDVDGMVVEYGDAGALVRAIVRLFTDQTGRDAMGRAGQARVADAFTAPHFAERLHRVLQLEIVPVAC